MNTVYMMAKGTQDTLEKLEHMIKENFTDLMVTMSISSDGCLFLNVWPQPSDTLASGFVMKYLPVFHIVGSMSEDHTVLLKLITFHGKVIDETQNYLTEEEKLNFVKQLEYSQLCQGITITHTNDLKLDMQTFSNLYLVEQFEEHVIVRSRKCKFAVFDNETVCPSCLEMYLGENVENDLLVDDKKCQVIEGIKVEPDARVYCQDELGENTLEEDEMQDWSQPLKQEFPHEQLLENELSYDRGNRKRKLDILPLTLGGTIDRMRDQTETDVVLRPFICDECRETFVSVRLLKRHICESGHTSQKRAKCFRCLKICTDQKSLRQHIFTSHLKLMPFKCSRCEFRAFKKSTIYAQHFKNIHGDEMGTSEDVDIVIDVAMEIDNYERQHKLRLGKSLLLTSLKHDTVNQSELSVASFFCDECDKSFPKVDQLTDHATKTLHQTKHRLKCFLCSSIQANTNVMRSHLCDIHWKLKPFKCKFCAFTSSRKDNHHCDQNDSQTSELVVLAEVIDQILIYEKRYNLHLGPLLAEEKINGQKNTLDENCEQGVIPRNYSKLPRTSQKGRSQNYLKYINRKNGRLKLKEKVKCFICSDIMVGPKVLRRHIWIHHLKLKPYKCRHCNFLSTSSFQIYRTHFKKAHSHDGHPGNVGDVETVVEAVQTIEEFERKHKLNLGPSLGKGLLVKNGNYYLKQELPQHNSDKEFNGTNDYFKYGMMDEPYKLKYTDDTLSSHVMESKGKQLVGELRTRQKPRSKLECYICLSSFTNQESFEADQQKHAEHIKLTGPFQCPTCYVGFEKEDINQHYETDHPELNAGCCLYCRAIIFRKKLRCHINNVHWAKPQLCNICGKSVSSGGMKDHVEVVHGDKTKDVICAHCGKKFTHQFRLNSHVRKMHDTKERFNCKFCSQTFREKHTLKSHYICVHLKALPYKCRFCDYVASQKQRVYDHCRTVHKRSASGSQDVEEIESELQRIKEFEIQHGLNKRTPPSTKGFVCFLCSATFVSSAALMKHECAHLELQPFECPKENCRMKFICKSVLLAHHRKVHFVPLDGKDVNGNQGLIELYNKVRTIDKDHIERYKEFVVLKPQVITDDMKEEPNECEEGQTFVNCNPYSCSRCDKSTFGSLAEFYYHFHQKHYDLVHEFFNEGSNMKRHEDQSHTATCKVCGFQTQKEDILARHVSEVHKFGQEEYDRFIEIPKVEYIPKVTRPRKYRCRYCMLYTAVKKFTVHRHIRNYHEIQDTYEGDVLLIPEHEQMQLHQQLQQEQQQQQLYLLDKQFNN